MTPWALEPGETPAWFVVYTDPQCEDRVARDLDLLHYRTWVPKLTKWCRRPKHKGGGREKRTLPLFPRYLFVGMNRACRIFWPILQTDKVQEILGNDAPLQVSPRIVSELRSAVERGDHDDVLVRTKKLAEMIGRQVEVTDGPFAGLIGTIERACKSSIVLAVRGDAGASIPLKLPISEFGNSVVYREQDDRQKQSAQ